MEVFNDYAKYYDLFYENKGYEKEVNDVLTMILKYGNNDDFKTILDLGCGTGRHAYEFSKKGYCVHGIDLSSFMISVAKEKYGKYANLSFEVSDIRDYRGAEKYDMCMSLFHVMSYQNRNEDFTSALRSAHYNLNPNGLFIFDFWYGVGVLNELPEVRIKTVENEMIEAVRIAQPVMHFNKNVCDVNYTVLITSKETGITRKLQETHPMRYFFKPEIEYMLNKNGFKLIDFLSCDNMTEPNGNTWTSYVIARKEGDD